jgi:hypothetical protein
MPPSLPSMVDEGEEALEPPQAATRHTASGDRSEREVATRIGDLDLTSS